MPCAQVEGDVWEKSSRFRLEQNRCVDAKIHPESQNMSKQWMNQDSGLLSRGKKGVHLGHRCTF